MYPISTDNFQDDYDKLGGTWYSYRLLGSYYGKGDSKINVGYNIYGYGNGIKATYSYGLSELFSLGAGATYYFNNDTNDYFSYFCMARFPIRCF